MGVALVRLLAADTGLDPLLTDFQIEDLLDLNGDDQRLAAADALDVIASSEALVSKKIRTQSLATDGPAVAASLRAHAASLRAQADSADADDEDGAFYVVDQPACWPEMTPRPWL